MRKVRTTLFLSFLIKKISITFLGIVILMFIVIQHAFSQNGKSVNGSPLNSAQSKFSQGNPGWSVSPFNQKVFVENKGQFDGKDGASNSKIKYALSIMGTDIYFTPTGLTHHHDEYKDLTEEEIIRLYQPDREGKDEEKIKEREHYNKTISHFVHMDWVGANPDANIVAEDPVTSYFTYPDPGDKSGSTGIKALAFRKITYQNLYPFIDVEYTFPEDKPGIKYTLILHPGADISVLKMHYSEVSDSASTPINMKLDEYGNILIESSFGTITDHAPVSRYGNGKSLGSGFELSGANVSFKLNNPVDTKYRKQEIIIDPWTTDPGFPGYDAAYDVHYDLSGNVYAYGGGYQWKEVKFNSAGSLIWVYTTSFNSSSSCTGGACYGDFTVDGNSGSSYIIEPLNNSGSPPRVVKLNSSGSLIGTNSGSTNLIEMWRIAFNNCTKQGVIAGGGNSVDYQACVLDTTMSSMTPVNVLGAGEIKHDFAMLALGNDSSCYMATAKANQSPYNANYNNIR